MTNFPQKYAEYQAQKKKNKKLTKGLDPKAKQYIKFLIAGYKANKFSLRPNEDEKDRSQLPMKYKLTYFDKEYGSQGSMSRTQRRRMLKQIFGNQNYDFSQEDLIQQGNSDQITQPEYQQYEQQIQIKAKDLAKYIQNAQEILYNKRNGNLQQ